MNFDPDRPELPMFDFGPDIDPSDSAMLLVILLLIFRLLQLAFG